MRVVALEGQQRKQTGRECFAASGTLGGALRLVQVCGRPPASSQPGVGARRARSGSGVGTRSLLGFFQHPGTHA